MQDLLQLKVVSSQPGEHSKDIIQGFLQSQAREPFLSTHPDQTFAHFPPSRDKILVPHWFRCHPSPKILTQKSTSQYTEILTQYITEEIASGKLKMVPVTHSDQIHISPMDIIPKPHQPGRYRLIVDLSSPQNFSINDGIQSSLCSLVYTSVGQAAELVRECGKGALVAKLDLKSAYRMVPVHPADQHLLGLEWQDTTY